MQIGIWDERKVFGSRGQILKEEFVGRHAENNNRDVKPMNAKPTNVKPMNVKLVMFLYLYVFIYILCMLIVILHCISPFTEAICRECIGQNSFRLSVYLWRADR